MIDDSLESLGYVRHQISAIELETLILLQLKWEYGSLGKINVVVSDGMINSIF